MKPAVFFVIFLGMNVTFSQSQAASHDYSNGSCGTSDVSAIDQILIENQLHSLKRQRRMGLFNGASSQQIAIPVFFHVVTRGGTSNEGLVSRKDIEAQIRVLNGVYAPYGFIFVLKDIDFTENEKWFTAPISSEIGDEMKSSLHQGDSTTLNIYTIQGDKKYLGWSTFPWDYSSKTEIDGIVVVYVSLPNGSIPPYSEGATAVHEVGHWLGLYHTFQGGCRDGDYVADTPAVAKANLGCSELPIDSCPQNAGIDPIHNYMDYSDDLCKHEFTQGQIERMYDNFTAFRKIP